MNVPILTELGYEFSANMCNEGHTLFKGLNEFFPYCLHFHPNLKVFGTGDSCEHIFCGCEFCERRRIDSRTFRMGVKEFCMPIFHFAFALNVLCHIAIN
jgi:hypothetical protein